MIHLDTNYLIGLAVPGSSPAQNVDQWLAAGEPLAASALAWTEFLNGPVSADEIALVESVIEGNIVPFEKPTAVLASQLFNQGGRRRGSRFDCLIEATAILANAELATENRKDFEAFVPFGLKLK
ncbi:MAG: PIN domain-containing protein [Verrucomicrobiales bacterium]|nr:PIN domain-containing protein [Verrucomicrobiales bacterium]